MRLIAFLCALLVPSVFALAGGEPRVVVAVRADAPPVLDGMPDERIWTLAAPATGFTQSDPVDGQPSGERTEVRVLYDDQALYVGWVCHDSRPDAIVARLARRDDEIPSDWASVRIDADRDGLTAYEFTFNAAGVRVDIIQFDDGREEDASWDAVWDVEVARGTFGWAAEVRIPFGMLRYQEGTDTTERLWGVNFVRYITRTNERSLWAHTPKSEAGVVSRFGLLRGLRGLPRTRPLELLPFVLAESRHEPGSATVLARDRTTVDAGMDLKHGIGNNLTLDVTLRPDFAQVEADPAVLNLSTFETFFPERRPFFIEGLPITSFPTFGGGGDLFYTRRIGRSIDPGEISLPAGGRVRDVATSVGIIGAAKLSGRLPGGLSIGAVQAVTEREDATVVDGDGRDASVLVEPLASYSVVRLRQEIAPVSTVGGILTATAKEGRLPALTGGADWSIRFDDRRYLLDGFVAGSHAADDDGRRITGSAGRVGIARVGAIHWLWDVQGDFTTPRYDINDIGFYRRPGDYGLSGRLTYAERMPGRLLQDYDVSLRAHGRWNFSGANLARDLRLSGEVTFRNFWWMTWNAGVDAGAYDDRETRGNGLYARAASSSAVAYLYSDPRQAVTGKLGQRFGWDDRGQRFYAAELGVLVRPLGWLQLEAEAEYQRTRSEEAWVNNVDGPAGTASIFGDRSIEQLDFRLRGSVVFTRDLTLQVYAQLFAAEGTYENFRRLVTPSTFVPAAYGGSPDFLSQSVISNIVVRWEYRSGSTLYLVWSHAGDTSADPTGTSIITGMREALSLPSTDVLLLKVSYWFEI